MAISAGTIKAELILDAGKYEAGLAKAERQAGSFANRLQGVGSKMGQIGSTLTRKVTVPIAGMFATVSAGLVKAGIERTAFTESTRVALETMMGDTKKARVFIDDLAAFARKTPFAFPDLAASARNMIAFGMNAEDVIPTLTAIGDAVAGVGGGKPELDAISDAFGKIQASGKLSLNEIHSLSRQGIPALQILANQFGITGDEMREKISDGAVDANTAIKLLVKGIEEGTSGMAGNTARFAGMMDKTQFTWRGALDKMRGAWSRAGEEIVEKHMPNMKKAVNAITDAIGDMPAMIGPALDKVISITLKVVKAFADLSPETKALMLKMAALAMAVGPVLKAGNKLIDVGIKVGGMLAPLAPVFGKVTGAATAVGGATTVAGSSFTAMGLAGAAAGLLLNPVTIGIAGVAAGAIFLAKKLREDSIPAVDLFGEECSEATKEAVGGFLELEGKATASLKQLAWSGKEITDEMRDDLVGTYREMKDQIVNELEEQKEKALESIGELVAKSTEMTVQEKEEMLRITREKYDEQIATTEEQEQKIIEIIDNSRKEHGRITKEAQLKIDAIQVEMKETAIITFSESEQEQLAIMERLKAQSGVITARQAAEIIKNSLAAKEGSIKEAEESYTEQLKIAGMLRAQGGAEAAAMADKIEREARRQKEEAIKNAEDMHKNVVSEAEAQCGEHIKYVDTETGEIKSKWQVMCSDVGGAFSKFGENAQKLWTKTTRKIKEVNKDAGENTSQSWGYHVGVVQDFFGDLGRSANSKFGSIRERVNTTTNNATSNLKSKWADAHRNVSSKWSSFKSKASDVWGSVTNWVQKAIGKIREWNRTPLANKTTTITQKLKTIGQRIGSNYRGTSYWRGGLTWVGEDGPELMSLPRGTRIFNNQQSMQMAGAATGGSGFSGTITLEVPVQIDGRTVAQATAKFTSQELLNLMREGGR